MSEHLVGRLDAGVASGKIAHEYRRMIDVYDVAADETPAAA